MKASLVYKVSCRTATPIQKNPVSKIKNKQTKKTNFSALISNIININSVIKSLEVVTIFNILKDLKMKTFEELVI